MFEEIKAIVVEQLGVDADKVTLDATILDDLGADSLDVVELLTALEEKYNIEISDEEAEKINTIGDIVNYIEGQAK